MYWEKGIASPSTVCIVGCNFKSLGCCSEMNSWLSPALTECIPARFLVTNPLDTAPEKNRAVAGHVEERSPCDACNPQDDRFWGESGELPPLGT